MRRRKLTGLTAVAMSAATMLVGGFASRPGPAGREAIKREVIKVVGSMPGPLHAQVTAKGAFNARGYFVKMWTKLPDVSTIR